MVWLQARTTMLRLHASMPVPAPNAHMPEAAHHMCMAVPGICEIWRSRTPGKPSCCRLNHTRPEVTCLKLMVWHSVVLDYAMMGLESAAGKAAWAAAQVTRCMRCWRAKAFSCATARMAPRGCWALVRTERYALGIREHGVTPNGAVLMQGQLAAAHSCRQRVGCTNAYLWDPVAMLLAGCNHPCNCEVAWRALPGRERSWRPQAQRTACKGMQDAAAQQLVICHSEHPCGARAAGALRSGGGLRSVQDAAVKLLRTRRVRGQQSCPGWQEYRAVRKGVQDAAVKVLSSCSVRGQPSCPWRQVYRAVRKGVQDVAVKLLTNVDAGQLAVFLEVMLALP